MGNLDSGAAGFAQGFIQALRDKQDREERMKESSEDRALRKLQIQMQARQQGLMINGDFSGIEEDPVYEQKQRGLLQEKAALGAIPTGAIPNFEDNHYNGYSFPQEYKDITRMRAEMDPYGIKGVQAQNAKLGLVKNQQDIAEGKEKASRAQPDQYKAGGFAKRTEQAEKVFGDLGKKGFNRASKEAALNAAVSSLPIIGGFLKSENLGMQQQGEDNFLNAVLRRESGASISPDERLSGERQYFDRPGDTPEIQEQKRKNRELVINTLKAEAGKGYDQIAEPGLMKEDPNILSYAKQYGLDYQKAEQILRSRGYGK